MSSQQIHTRGGYNVPPLRLLAVDRKWTEPNTRDRKFHHFIRNHGIHAFDTTGAVYLQTTDQTNQL